MLRLAWWALRAAPMDPPKVFITIANFVLMNLITAVIVENAFSDSRTEEKELARRLAIKKEKEAEKLKLLFQAVDEDRSGYLSRDELTSAVKKKAKVRQKLRALDILPKDIDELWEILDDGDGELTADEFANGLQRLRGEAKAKDIQHLYRELRVMQAAIGGLDDNLNYSEERMRMVKSSLQRAKVDIASMQRTLSRAKDAVKVAAITQPFR